LAIFWRFTTKSLKGRFLDLHFFREIGYFKEIVFGLRWERGASLEFGQLLKTRDFWDFFLKRPKIYGFLRENAEVLAFYFGPRVFNGFLRPKTLWPGFF
jgi:hypothetical protein